ncbi:MAG: ABC transporter permease [Acidobacteriota bacterium]|nr:ABC transporter permease [Acidobacteriota bacterium]
MIRHLLKIVWNRKRVNALIMTEICLSFLVLFALFTAVTYYYSNFVKPMGFDYHDVWSVQVLKPNADEQEENRDKLENYVRQIRIYLDSQDAVENYAMADITPYSGWTWNNYILNGERRFLTQFAHVDLNFPETMSMELVSGRWFDQTDEAQNWLPVMINEKLAEELFADSDPLGQKVMLDRQELDLRVVGVFTDYRKDGEFSLQDYMTLVPLRTRGPRAVMPQKLMLKMAPGTPVVYEEEMVKKLESIAEGWSFTVTPLERMRKAHIDQYMTQIAVMSLVAFFMLAMVTLGLVGVLWQNVTRRTSEMGVRRAKGATRNKIYTQVLGEFLVISSLAILLGSIFAAQIPILGLTSNVGLDTFAIGFIAAGLMIYLLTTLSALYPSWLATTVNPAEALHYE